MHVVKRLTVSLSSLRRHYVPVSRYKRGYGPYGLWNLVQCVRCSTGPSPTQTPVLDPRYNKNVSSLFALGVSSPSDLHVLCDEAVDASTAVVASVLEQHAQGSLDNKVLLYTIDHISNTLCLVADPCELLRHVHPCGEYRNAANMTVEKISSFISRINIDDQLYDIMTSAYHKSHDSLNTEEQLVLHHMIESMRNQGVGLSPSLRASYLELQREEAAISFDLSDSATLKHASVGSINGRIIPPNPAVYAYILRNSPDESVRRVIWEAQTKCDPVALDKLLRLHRIRSSIAKTRGFRNFAECAQRECIMNNPEAVEKFLRKCAASLVTPLQEELHELSVLKQSLLPKGTSMIRPWDIDYLVSMERDKLGVQFRVSTVLAYFERLMCDMFGVKLVRDTSEPLWHPLVAKYTLVRNTHILDTATEDNSSRGSGDSGLQIAQLYTDLFARENKVNVCAQFTVRCSRLIRGVDSHVEHGSSREYVTTTYPDGSQRQVPATAIVCSFVANGARDDVDSALDGTYIDLGSAMTLFHELGHTVHALLSRTDLQHLSGNRGGVDFAEFSSHLFELYFVDGLGEMCKIEGLDNSASTRASMFFKKYRAVDAARMVLMAMLDLKFYSSDSVTMEEVNQLYTSLGIFEEQYQGEPMAAILGLPAVTNFDHLVPYGATYFCYLYSRVLAIKVWRSFGNSARCRLTGDLLSQFLAKGSIDASIKPLNDLARCDLESMEDDLFM